MLFHAFPCFLCFSLLFHAFPCFSMLFYVSLLAFHAFHCFFTEAQGRGFDSPCLLSNLSYRHHPPSIIHHPPSIIHHPSSIVHHPSSTIHHPPSIGARAPSFPCFPCFSMLFNAFPCFSLLVLSLLVPAFTSRRCRSALIGTDRGRSGQIGADTYTRHG